MFDEFGEILNKHGNKFGSLPHHKRPSVQVSRGFKIEPSTPAQRRHFKAEILIRAEIHRVQAAIQCG